MPRKGNIPWNKGLHTGLVPSTAFKKGHKQTSNWYKKVLGRVPWNKGKKGLIPPEKHPSWKGGRQRHGDGYIQIVIKGHPCGDSRGRILEHRWVMEQKIGR